MRLYYCVILILCMIQTGFALPLEPAKIQFSVKQANQAFDRINLQLSIQNLNLSNLAIATNTLSALITQAEECVLDTQKKLTNLELPLQQTTQTPENNKPSADLVYLRNEQKKLASQQAQCRLFTIRAKEAISAYRKAMVELKQKETLARTTPDWKLIKQIIASPPSTAWIKPVALLNEKNLLPAITISGWFWSIGFVINLMLACGIFFQLRHGAFARHHFRPHAIRIPHIVLLVCGLIMGELYTYLFLQQSMSIPLLTKLTSIVASYVVSIILTLLIFKLKKVRAFFYWYGLNEDFFRRMLIVMITFYGLLAVEHLLNHEKIINQMLSQLTHSILLISILIMSIYMVFYFCQRHRHVQVVKHHRQFIQRLCSSLLISCIVLDVLGYHTLATRLMLSGFATLAIILSSLIINLGIKKIYLLLSQPSTLHHQIFKSLGYKNDQICTEFFILKLTLQIVVFILALYFIGKSWWGATYYTESLYTQFVYGISLGNFTLYPARIVVGVVVFCLLYLFSRGISTHISRRQQQDEGEETQVAIASILTYLGFAIALVAGLLIAGFDFTGLAIVAGALSVGIGLGLQSIVNNFVSGIILLIEKPIKPGDRINVDGVEGVVKKIRIRSTQIISSAREDIIVPNSDLITRRVTNFMYSDRQLSVYCQVGVAYGSNIALVKDLLLNAANLHDEVVKTARNKPSVLFKSFAESGFILQLCCLIKDANKKSVVESDLNFLIEQLFRDHHIEMAHQYRDVHIKVKDLQKLRPPATET